MIFEPEVTQGLLDRIEKLTPTTKPEWGKMTVSQMMAHCSVAYDMTYGAVSVKNNFFMKLMLKYFVKKGVVGPKPYAKNIRTAPVFVVEDERDFATEKAKLIGYLRRSQEEGEAAHEGRENVSFGPLTAYEWSVLYYKHLDHHLRQFGV